jgi:hypothetical protein
VFRGSYEDSDGNLDVGTTYWYSCRIGLFMMGENNLTSYIDMVSSFEQIPKS